VEQVASTLTPGTALDLAGGEGRNSLWLAEKGWKATCVDFSQVALDRAMKLAETRLGADQQNFDVMQADLSRYAPPALSYDLVLVVYLQIPRSQRTTILRNAAIAVAPGGHLLVVAHHSDNLHMGVGGPQDPAHLYTADDVADDLIGLHLESRRVERVMRPVTTDAGPLMAVDALYLGRRK